MFVLAIMNAAHDARISGPLARFWPAPTSPVSSAPALWQIVHMRSLLLVLALVPLAAFPARAAERERVLVLDLKTTGTTPDEAALLVQIITESLSRSARFDVSSSSDLRALTDVAADKAAAGCDDSSCLSELAGALGARYVLSGTAGRLGKLIIVTLNFVDVSGKTPASRQRLESQSPEELPRLVDSAVLALIGAPAAPPPPPPEKPLPVMTIAGGALAGVGVLVGAGAGAYALVLDGQLAEASSKPEDKQTALATGPAVVTVAVVGGVVAVVGAGVLAASLVME